MTWEKKKQFDEKLYPDLMVDLETLGTDTDSCVLSIGAVRFRLGILDDTRTIRDEQRSFYSRLDTESQAHRGRSQDPATMDWWANQSDAARAVFEEDAEPVGSALDRFLEFCTGVKRVWGNGNMFDNAIVRSLCRDYERPYPVEYWKDLDVRTITYLWNLVTNWGSNGKRPNIIVGEEHNALDDARRQVIQVQQMYKDIRKDRNYES